jgi:ABC-2 type transport system permease protein
VSTSAPTSVIHDIGYKPYTGPRQGHAQIVRGLYVHSLRAVFGLGRGGKAKVVPFAVLAIMLFPAVLNVYEASKNQALVMPYSLLAYRMFLFSVVFVAVAAPELVSRDLRHHTLPLYFSRPLRRSDYPLAKLLALISGVLIIEMLPILMSYLGQVASATSGHEIWQDTRAAFPGVFVAVLYAVFFSTIALLLASTTGRRVIATGVIAILFLVAMAISGVLQDAVGTTYQDHTVTCVEPTVNPKTASGDLFGIGADNNGQPTAVVSQLCPGVNMRHDNIDVEGRLDPNRPGYADLTIHDQTPVYSDVAKVGGMTNPVTIIEGTRIWVFHATDSDMPDPSPLGPAYAAELAVLALATGGGLFLRYRKVSVS